MNVFELIKEKLEEKQVDCFKNMNLVKDEDGMNAGHIYDEYFNKSVAYEDAISIVYEVAQEYKPYNFGDKIFMLESELAENGDIENLNKLIELQNLLKYFEDSLGGVCNNGWIPCSERLPNEEEMKEKYKLALFAVVRNSKVMPVGTEMGKSMDEINAMSVQTVDELIKMCDFEKIKLSYDNGRAGLQKAGAENG